MIDRPMETAARRGLLVCGILASLLYAAMNVLAVLLFEGYSPVNQTVSELSAIGAPTRVLWNVLGIVYDLLVIAFGWGVWKAAGPNRALRTVSWLLVAHGLIGFVWPPMHARGEGSSLTDTMHIVVSVAAILIMLLTIGFGSAAFGRSFRLYSLATLLVHLVFGIRAGMDGPRIAANLPTPWVGVWQRINIGAYLLWVVVLAAILLRAGSTHRENRRDSFTGVPEDRRARDSPPLAERGSPSSPRTSTGRARCTRPSRTGCGVTRPPRGRPSIRRA